jgi:phosphoribosylformylglycinamidine (FGAM) synthase PurS component
MTDPWQLTDKQAKEHGQIILETKAKMLDVAAVGTVRVLKALNLPVSENAHEKLAKLFEEICQ